MRWIETKIETTREGLPFIEAVLLNANLSGWQTYDDAELGALLRDNPHTWDYVDDELLSGASAAAVGFYVLDGAAGQKALEQILIDIYKLRIDNPGVDFGPLNAASVSRDDADWQDNWKKYFKPFRVGVNLVVKPAWEDYENTDNRTVININPGHAFGTGQHETTRMCMAAIEKYLPRGARLLDVGSGSGILSILALLFGAEYCDAVDFDIGAADVAMENAALNNIPDGRLRVYTGDFINDTNVRDAFKPKKYGAVVANITAGAIISVARILDNIGCLEQGAPFISSGIIKDRLDETRRAVEDAGFVMIETMTDGEWVCLCAKRAR